MVLLDRRTAIAQDLGEQLARWYVTEQRTADVEAAVVDVLRRLEALDELTGVPEEERETVLDALEDIRENMRNTRIDVRDIRNTLNTNSTKLATLSNAVLGNGSLGLNDRVSKLEQQGDGWTYLSTEFPKFVTEFRDLQELEQQEHAAQVVAVKGARVFLAIATLSLAALGLLLKVHG